MDMETVKALVLKAKTLMLMRADDQDGFGCIALVFKDDMLLPIKTPAFVSYESKVSFCAYVREVAYQLAADAVVTITEAWMVTGTEDRPLTEADAQGIAQQGVSNSDDRVEVLCIYSENKDEFLMEVESIQRGANGVPFNFKALDKHSGGGKKGEDASEFKAGGLFTNLMDHTPNKEFTSATRARLRDAAMESIKQKAVPIVDFVAAANRSVN